MHVVRHLFGPIWHKNGTRTALADLVRASRMSMALHGMVSNVVGCPIEEVKMDMPVDVIFDNVNPDWTLFKFRPAA